MGRKRQTSDEQILAAARERFVADGPGASTKSIATAAGVSEAVLFQRFGTKADLFFAAMVVPAFDPDEIFAGLGRLRSGQRRLERISTRILARFRAVFPILLPVMSHPDYDPARFMQPGTPNAERQLHKALAAWLADEDAAGRLRCPDPVATAGLLVATLHSLALYELMGAHGGDPMDDAIPPMIAALWHGLAPEVEAATTTKSRRKKTNS